MQRYDGRILAEKILVRLRAAPKPKKELAIVVPANDDSSSEGFVSEIRDFAAKLGIVTVTYYKTYLTTTEELIGDLGRLAANPIVGGVVMILPLPKNIDREKVLSAIPIAQDVDFLNPDNHYPSYFLAPASLATVRIWQELIHNFWSASPPRKVAVVGRGILVGKPVEELLRAGRYEVSVFNSKTSLAGLKDAEVVILGTGVPKLVSPTMLASGAVVIDFGYPGDFDDTHPEAEKISWYVPAKGGTGPILVASMFLRFYGLTKTKE